MTLKDWTPAQIAMAIAKDIERAIDVGDIPSDDADVLKFGWAAIQDYVDPIEFGGVEDEINSNWDEFHSGDDDLTDAGQVFYAKVDQAIELVNDWLKGDREVIA